MVVKHMVLRIMFDAGRKIKNGVEVGVEGGKGVMRLRSTVKQKALRRDGNGDGGWCGVAAGAIWKADGIEMSSE